MNSSCFHLIEKTRGTQACANRPRPAAVGAWSVLVIREPFRTTRMAQRLYLLFALVGVLGACDAERSDPRPSGTIDDVLALSEREDLNVLFILVDTLRADHLSAYGYERPTSPRIQALAETGIRFENHVSQSSWTKCSMASMWTGLYPPRNGVLRSNHAVSQEAVLPAEIFREAGFRTAGIWRNGWIASNFGFGQGFETYTQPRPSKLDRKAPNRRPNLMLAGSDSDLIRSAFRFLRAYGEERWFLYLHMMDVHQYVSSEEEAIFGTDYLDIYDNSILWTDTLIGHLLDELDRRGLRDRTLIVFASDHGEAFGEHSGEGHARNVYGEVTETPLILSLPFWLEPGLVVESRSENVDLWPTVLDLAGLSPMDDPDGRSLVSEIMAHGRGEQPVGDALAFAVLDQNWGQITQDPGPQVAVNRDPWRRVYSSLSPKTPELFNKVEDPMESQNLAKEHPELTEELVKMAREHLERTESPWGGEAPAIEMDALQVEQLRALGYGIE